MKKIDVSLLDFVILIILGVILCLLASATRPKSAEAGGFLVLPQEKYFRAIVGEAEGEGLDGMIAVACGIMNRPEGLQGVFGVRTRRWTSTLPHIRRQARLAWEYAQDSREECYGRIQGADMWENTEAFGQPKSWPVVVFITKVGNHNFYRRVTSKQ